MSNNRTNQPPACSYCAGERSPGWIEMPDNGPTVPCPICNPKTAREIEYDRAIAARRAMS